MTLVLLLATLEAQSRADVLAAMKKAATFYTQQVSKEGGFHHLYASDLSYGRSEHAGGPTQVETQRDGTPRVGMALLEAHAATGDNFYLEAARRTAHALVQGQLCSGGWDYLIEFDAVRRKTYPYRAGGDCQAAKPPTTLDDNVTQACLRLLMRVDAALQFQDAAIHEAAVFALDQLARAQFSSGAWPQRFTGKPAQPAVPKQASYPETWPRQWPGENYQSHYTFNDNALCDVIDAFLEAAAIYHEPRYRETAVRGGAFILKAQMPEPQPGWAQQYNAEMHPAWARVFEPPAVSGGESLSIIQMLLVLYGETGGRAYLTSASRALTWLEKSVLPRPAAPSEVWRRVKPDEPVLARFYELRTNRPLFITKGTQVQAKGLGAARIDGYELTYSDASVIAHYAVLVSGARLKTLRRDLDALQAGKPPRPRSGALHNLSPWNDPRSPLTRKPSPASVQATLAALDARGAWAEEGVIGKADRVLQVQAARPMILTINGRPTEIRENDRLELFQGPQPPSQRILRSVTFAENLERLAASVSAAKN
jgi:hypothetical protein